MKKIIAMVAFLIGLLFFIGGDTSPFFDVMIGSEGIVTQNGKIVSGPKKPGLHFKVPLVQKIHLIETHRIRFLNLSVHNDRPFETTILWTVSNSVKFF